LKKKAATMLEKTIEKLDQNVAPKLAQFHGVLQNKVPGKKGRKGISSIEIALGGAR